MILAIGIWFILSTGAAFVAGWVVGKYGYHEPERRAPREVLPIRYRKLLAAEMTRANKMEIRK